ncbi:MAG TPA: phosphoadenylyl-sulfate reductase [Candidatus Limnocylindria bacterium]|nr:phosphoadenylyl-sulfate reductase [Candidatus Limnocylindria bacterium]
MASFPPAADLERLTARAVLEHAVGRHHPRLAVACSFQKEAAVIVDMLLRIEPQARIFTLDTGVLFPETYDTWRRVEAHYGIEIEAYRGRWVDGLWASDPDACCGMRKVEPLRRALAGADAWVTGLRREQSPERAGTPKLGWDEANGKWKYAPLADWSERDVWSYVADHGVPYNPLHDEGYDSIGCTHCTVAGSGRDGRWAGTGKLECGLHAQPAR